MRFRRLFLRACCAMMVALVQLVNAASTDECARAVPTAENGAHAGHAMPATSDGACTAGTRSSCEKDDPGARCAMMPSCGTLAVAPLLTRVDATPHHRWPTALRLGRRLDPDAPVDVPPPRS